MHDYLKLFDEIVDIVHNDYSGCNDKKGWDNPAYFREKLEIMIVDNTINNRTFKEVVDDYLCDLKDRHIFLVAQISGDTQEFSNGFTAYRYENCLYVVKTFQENTLEAGDIILALDNIPILSVKEKFKRYLDENTSERENWKPIIKKFNTCTVKKKGGSIVEFTLGRYKPINPSPEYSFKELSEEISFLKFTNFANEDVIHSLIAENKESIQNSRFLIVDVRGNGGGSDSSYLPLLKYIFKDTLMLSDVLKNDSQSTNYTERNCRTRINDFKEYLKTNLPPETITMVNSLIKNYTDNYGKGFILDKEWEFKIEGLSTPEKVYVITDSWCGSSGDAFVETCSYSDKVTIVGRPTMGITDYSNLCHFKLNDYFTFMYPTSRVNKIDHGKGLTGKGVPVDIYIPWTPEHLSRDVDLDYVLDHIKNNYNF